MNDMTKVDLCNWYVKWGQPDGVMLKLPATGSERNIHRRIGIQGDAHRHGQGDPAAAVNRESLVAQQALQQLHQTLSAGEIRVQLRVVDCELHSQRPRMAHQGRKQLGQLVQVGAVRLG